MDPEFRPLSTRERGLIDKLLELQFEGRDELLSQLDLVSAKQVEDDGTLFLRCSCGTPALKARGLATEGECKDADGQPIFVLLHVDRDGFMRMLEILKHGTCPIIAPPSASGLALLDPPVNPPGYTE